MTDIIFNTNDEDLKNISTNNSMSIDINGSVNICSVKCGHELEDTNNIKFNDIIFSSLTN